MKKYCKPLAYLLTASLVITMAAFPADAAAKPKLNKTRLTLKVGRKKKLTIKNRKSLAIRKVTFSTKNKKIARVTEKGLVRAVKPGNTKIICRIVLKNQKSYSLSCRVQVITAAPVESIVPSMGPVPPSSTVVPNPPAISPVASAKPGFTSKAPAVSANPDFTSKAPAVSVKPGAASITPAASGTPDAAAPAGSDTPESSGQPSKTPAHSNAPVNTPAPSMAPASPSIPVNTPEISMAPASPSAPVNTPENTASGTPTEAPVISGTPSTSSEPAVTDTPAPSERVPHLSSNGILTYDDGVMREGIDSYDIVKMMGAGTNLGNTMEAYGGNNYSNTSNYETLWGQPVTTQEMVDGMKAAGFDSIRIPVAWSNMMADDGTYTINEKYFNRVETIMNYAFNADMYVIINIHWDGGWWARFGSKTEQERKDAMTKYKNMWTQIANRYKEYSDHLIFESANEELGTRLNSTEDYNGSGYYAEDDLDSLYKLTNEINQTFVDVVRSTGGNNARRFLLIAGYDTDISKTCDLRYKMPADTIDSHLMVSIHYYSPSIYCISNTPNNSWGYSASWGTEKDIETLQQELAQMRIAFVNKGYPVIIGEYGVTDTKISENNFVRKEGRDLFFRTVCEYALDNNMCPVLWDCSQIFDRRSLTMTNEAEKTLYKEMNEKAHTSELVKPSVSDSSYHWTGTVSNHEWTPSTVTMTDTNSTFTVSKTGGCFTISGIDWSGFQKPVLKVTCRQSSGSALLRLANQIDTSSNPYWYHLYDDGTGVISEKNISSGSTISIEIPLNDMTSTQNLYFNLAGSVDFSGTLSLEIVEE